MERRKFLIGAGSLAAGSAAAMGTGAFSSVTANRDAEIDIEDDANAYLGLVAGQENGWAVQTAGGSSPDGTMMIEMNGQSNTSGGTGVNANAVNVFDDVFRILNQADSEKEVWITFSKSGGSNNKGNVDIDFYTDSGGSIVGQSNAQSVTTGSELKVGIEVDTTGVSSPVDPGHILEDITIEARDVQSP